MARVEAVAALYLVGDPYARAVLGPVREMTGALDLFTIRDSWPQAA